MARKKLSSLESEILSRRRAIAAHERLAKEIRDKAEAEAVKHDRKIAQHREILEALERGAK